MVLLSAVLDHTPDSTVCVAEVREHAAFPAPNGVVPSWVGIEYMAQCIAAHRGLHAKVRGEAIKVGFLIGSKRVDFHSARFSLGQVLEVRVRRLWGDRGLGAFACSVLDQKSRAVLVEGTLNVFLPDAIEPFMPKERP